MAGRITEGQKANINLMNADVGGSMSSSQIRVETNGNPVLIIGLGGTGIDALLHTKSLLNKRFELPDVPDKATAIPENIRLLGIDSDTTSKTRKVAGMSLGENEFFSINNNIVNLLSLPKKPSYITEWLDDEAKLKQLVTGVGTEGANGIRQCGRLLLFNKAQVLFNKLRAIVSDLQVYGNKIQVFITTGICGGTGSGIFADVSYIVRQICGCMTETQITGILFMPDINISKVGPGAYNTVLMKNGFAAMKELEYLMNTSQHPYDPFKQTYASGAGGEATCSVESTNNIYDSCILISEQAAEGFVHMPPEKRYSYCMSLAAETVCSFISSSKTSKEDGAEAKEQTDAFSIKSFVDNMHAMLAVAPEPNMPCYIGMASVGLYAAILPKSEMLEYISGKLFAGMKGLWDNSPTTEQRDIFVQSTVGLDMFSLENMFDANVAPTFPAGLKTSCFVPAALKATRQAVEDTGNSWLTSVDDTYRRAYSDNITVLFEKFKNEINKVFSDPERGPFYASRLINSDDAYCVLKNIDSSISETESRLAGLRPENLKAKKAEADNYYNLFRSALLDVTGKKLERYYTAINEYFEKEKEKRRLQNIQNFLTELRRMIIDYNNTIVDHLVGILNELKTVFEKDLNIVTGVESATTEGLGTNYEWKMYDTNSPEFTQFLDSAMANADTKECIRGLMSGLLNKFTAERDKDNFDTSSFVSDFISKYYSEALNKNMDDFFKIKYPTAQTQSSAATALINELKQKSVVNFNCNSMDLDKVQQYVQTILPPDAGTLIAAATQDNDTKKYIAPSLINNRVSMFRFAVGISLSYHNNMHEYENTYYITKQKNPDGMVGQHIYVDRTHSGGRDWTQLSSPLYDEGRYDNQRTATGYAEVCRENGKHRDEFNRANNYGLIDLSEGISKIRYRKDITIDDVNAVELDLTNAGSCKKAIESYKAIQDKLKETTGDAISIAPVKFLEATPEESMCAGYVTTYGAWKYLEAMLDIYETAQAGIDKATEAIESMKSGNKTFNEFFDALYTGVIYKEKTFYRYVNNKEEAVTLINTLKIEDTTEQKHFPLFALYNAFKELESNARTFISKKADKAHEEDIPDKDIEFVKDLSAEAKDSLRGLDDIDYELNELNSNKDAIIDLYKKIVEKADTTIDLLG